MISLNHMFDPYSFLLPFEGRENLIEAYLDSLPANQLTVPRPIKSAADFFRHLQACAEHEQRTITAGMLEAWEMTSDEMHERMLAALRRTGTCTDSHKQLPAECLALHVLTTSRSLFESVVTLDQFSKCDALEMFMPKHQVSLVSNLDAAALRFRAEVSKRCYEKFGSPRVLVRHFDSADVLTIGFYSEKLPKSHRRLKGTPTNPQLALQEDRPLQFDAVFFERSTGVLSIRSGWGRLTDHIRKAFAESFLNASDAYEWTDAAKILQLGQLLRDHKTLIGIDGQPPLIKDVDFTIPRDEFSSKYKVGGANALETIKRDGLFERACEGATRIVIQMARQNGKRRRRVVLTAPNKVEFKRGQDAAMLIAELKQWNVIQTKTILAEAA
jgi:hypothetical protein